MHLFVAKVQYLKYSKRIIRKRFAKKRGLSSDTWVG